MPLYYGSNQITALKYGSLDITHLYKGSTLIWSKGVIRDPFDGANGPIDPTKWTDDGGSAYPIGVENGLLRLLLPDNVFSINPQAARARFTAAQHEADGYVEFVVGNPGSGDHATDVLRRATNGTGAAAGAGVRMRSSSLFILRRVAGVDTEMVACGAFQGGDRIRLTQKGNLHTMQRNGRFVGEWPDNAGTALNTAAQRTLAIALRGSKDWFGPRRFSPAIDSIECV